MKYELKLYISGDGGHGRRAISNMNEITDSLTAGECEMEVIDIVNTPAAAIADHIIATPALVKVSPLPIRKVIGDLSDKDKVLFMLGLK